MAAAAASAAATDFSSNLEALAERLALISDTTNGAEEAGASLRPCVHLGVNLQMATDLLQWSLLHFADGRVGYTTAEPVMDDGHTRHIRVFFSPDQQEPVLIALMDTSQGASCAISRFAPGVVAMAEASDAGTTMGVGEPRLIPEGGGAAEGVTQWRCFVAGTAVTKALSTSEVAQRWLRQITARSAD